MKRAFTIGLLLAANAVGQVIETNWETGIVLVPVKDAGTHAMLRASLQDTDPLVRIQGLVALTTLRDPADAPLLRALQTDPVAAVREQLNLTARPAALPLAAPANPADWLHDVSGLRRQVAVDAIARRQLVDLAPALPALLETPDSVLRRHVCEALGQLRADQSAALAAQLGRDDDPFVRRAAGDALLAIHSAAGRAALIALLQHERGPVRLEAARALGNWADPTVAPVLHGLLADADYGVARLAAEGLGKLGNPDSQRPLLAHLAKSPDVVQDRIAWALGEFRTAEAVPVLLPLLTTHSERVEPSVVEALGKIGDKQVIPTLRKVLVEMTAHGSYTRRSTLAALRRLGDRESTQRVLQFVTEKVVPPPPGVLPAVWTYDADEVRMEALQYLVFIGGAPLVDEVIGRMKEVPTWQLRRAMVAAFEKLNGKTYWAEFTIDTRHYWMETLTGEFYPKPPGGLGIVLVTNPPPR